MNTLEASIIQRDTASARDLMEERIRRKLIDLITGIEGSPPTAADFAEHGHAIFFEMNGDTAFTWKGKQILSVGKVQITPGGAFVVPMCACAEHGTRNTEHEPTP